MEHKNKGPKIEPKKENKVDIVVKDKSVTVNGITTTNGYLHKYDTGLTPQKFLKVVNMEIKAKDGTVVKLGDKENIFIAEKDDVTGLLKVSIPRGSTNIEECPFKCEIAYRE